MKKALPLGVLAMVFLASQVVAQPPPSLTFGEDYTFSDEVHNVTTVQVSPNRVDHYLAGLHKSWVPANEIAVEMGLMKGYKIYVSELENSGDFNVVLVTVYENAAQRHKLNDPATAAEFQKRVEEKFSEQEGFEVTEGYTKIRDIVGEYLMREVKLK